RASAARVAPRRDEGRAASEHRSAETFASFRAHQRDLIRHSPWIETALETERGFLLRAPRSRTMHKRHAHKNPSRALQTHIAFRDGASLECPTCERGRRTRLEQC